MKALSFWQPWCEVILNHGKRIENRERWTGCNYRGPILIHAAKTFGGPTVFDNTVMGIFHRIGPDGRIPDKVTSLHAEIGRGGRWVPMSTLPLGGIVGRANIVDVVKTELDIRRQGRTDQLQWWHGGFALVLDQVERLPFVPWKGKQGFFDVPDDYATRGQL